MSIKHLIDVHSHCADDVDTKCTSNRRLCNVINSDHLTTHRLKNMISKAVHKPAQISFQTSRDNDDKMRLID